MIYFHVWHFLYQQVQLDSWFGNVVAGVVVFVVVDICWQLFLKKWVKEGLAKVHAEALKIHHEKVVRPELDARHNEIIDQQERHHRAQLTAIKKGKP